MACERESPFFLFCFFAFFFYHQRKTFFGLHSTGRVHVYRCTVRASFSLCVCLFLSSSSQWRGVVLCGVSLLPRAPVAQPPQQWRGTYLRNEWGTRVHKGTRGGRPCACPGGRLGWTSGPRRLGVVTAGAWGERSAPGVYRVPGTHYRSLVVCVLVYFFFSFFFFLSVGASRVEEINKKTRASENEVDPPRSPGSPPPRGGAFPPPRGPRRRGRSVLQRGGAPRLPRHSGAARRVYVGL